MAGYIGNIPVPQGIQNKESFTATAAQTTFNTNGYTDGAFISVYLNGVRLVNGTDYTATNGSDVVLASAANTGDVLDFESFNSFSLVNQTFENITTKNPTHEDTDGGRESAISFQGEQSGGEISTLAAIQASHDGTADDQKGDLIFKTNDGSDNNAPTEAMRIDSDQNIIIGDASKGGNLGQVRIINDASSSPASLALFGHNNVSDGTDFAKIQLAMQTGGSGGNVVAQITGEAEGTAENAAHLTFETATGGTLSEAMRITHDGNVGIGVNDPDADLDISGGSNKLGILRVTQRASGAAAYGLDVGLDPSTGDPVFSRIVNDTVTEAMRIQRSTGNVGIGTADPLRQLHISNTSANSEIAFTAGTSGVSSILFGDGQTGTDVYRGYFQYNHSDDAMLFATSTAERMRINSSGGVAFGNTSFSAASGNIMVNEGVYVGALSGDNQIRSSSAGGGSATLYIGNAAIQVSSDQRLKTNIIDTTMAAVNKINQVRVVDFNWDDPSDTAYNNRNARGTWTGVIAQELIDIFPFAVNAPRNEDDLTIDNDSDTKWQVDQGNLVPVLMKAIQELSAKVETLETENTAIKARLEALEAE